jgi:hypothetical protein
MGMETVRGDIGTGIDATPKTTSPPDSSFLKVGFLLNVKLCKLKGAHPKGGAGNMR